MFNLYQIVTGAQGGQAIDHLAQRFGLTREQADSAVKALIPALSTAFMTKAAHPGGLQDLAGALNDDQHKQAYADPNVAHDPATQEKAGTIASSLFGNSAILQNVVQQAAQYTGVPAATIQQMLPVVVSLILGGVATALHNQNLGGVLGQLAGGLGGLFGQAGTAPGQAGGGGFGGLFGNILGSVFGGAPGATPTAGPGAGLPPVMQAGLDALAKMFQPGVQPNPGQPNDLGDQIRATMAGRPR